MEENIEKKEEGTEKKTSEETKDEEEKPTRAPRKSIKFNPEVLDDPDIGLKSLFNKLESFDPYSYSSETEALSVLMRKYQIWMHKIYPTTFDEMCWRIINKPSIRNQIRNTIYDIKGIERPSYDFDLDSEFQLPPERPQEISHEETGVNNPVKEIEGQALETGPNFISDDEEGSQETQPEILDIFVSQN